MNQLHYGDNLKVLRSGVIAPESVDLIYLDPPFNSKATYNVLFKTPNGHDSDAQVAAFEDSWHWGDQAELEYDEILHQPNTAVSELIQALHQFLHANDMMAYLVMMTNRLLALHGVLKPTGSLYLHCDPTASHYLRLLLDGIWGVRNFRNEIYWYYYNKMHDKRKGLFARATDTILFYVKNAGEPFYFQQLKEDRETPVKQLLRKKVSGKMVNVKDENGHVVYRWKEDKTIDNVWRIPCIQPASPERLGYQTQKPLALLERIILASSEKGGVVLDPFCGCGTTIYAAQKHNRSWIGIDVTHLAISLIEKRLEAFKGKAVYKVYGRPEDLAGARDLAHRDKYEFQWWACSLVNARPYQNKKKGADSGVDGIIYFRDDETLAKKIIVSVKGGGHINPQMIRDLVGVLQREKAEIGLFVTLTKPTGAMIKEAASAGLYKPVHFPQKAVPRIQILTIEELLNGANRPKFHDISPGNLAFHTAPEEAEKQEQKNLFDVTQWGLDSEE